MRILLSRNRERLNTPLFKILLPRQCQLRTGNTAPLKPMNGGYHRFQVTSARRIRFCFEALGAIKPKQLTGKCGLCRARVQEGVKALTPSRYLRAGEIDLAITLHQQPHSLKTFVVQGKQATLVNEFIGEVFDGVTQNFEGTPSLRGDPPPPVKEGMRAGGYR
jgi:hypothetical protein